MPIAARCWLIFPIGTGVDATKFADDIFASCGDGTLTVARETVA